MPLSDHERRVLADIESRLRADDPKFAKTVGTTTVSTHARRHVRFAIAAFAVGFVLLFVGVLVGIGWGIAGFALMLAGAVHGANMARRLGADSSRDAGGPLRGVQRYLDGARARDDERDA